MAENSGSGYRTRRRISEIEDLLRSIPTDQQIEEDAILKALLEAFVTVPENSALIQRRWRLSLQEGTEAAQAEIRRELRQRLDAFAAKELPKIKQEMFPEKQNERSF